MLRKCERIIFTQIGLQTIVRQNSFLIFIFQNLCEQKTTREQIDIFPPRPFFKSRNTFHAQPQQRKTLTFLLLALPSKSARIFRHSSPHLWSGSLRCCELGTGAEMKAEPECENKSRQRFMEQEHRMTIKNRHSWCGRRND